MATRIFYLLLFSLALANCEAQPKSDSTGRGDHNYTYAEASWDGIGKFYMGREIAHVMGHLGARWLERSSREAEENVSQAIKNMDLKPNEVVADIGAGSGYYSFRIAKKLNAGKVIAVDLQPQMLAIMRKKIDQKEIDNIDLIRAEEDNPNLPTNSIDMAFMVDVYHELSHPKEVMQHIVAALKPGGRFILLEYRMEDPSVPIKRLHKMSLKQAVKEMEAVGLRLRENKNNLPWQHFMVFVKK